MKGKIDKVAISGVTIAVIALVVSVIGYAFSYGKSSGTLVKRVEDLEKFKVNYEDILERLRTIEDAEEMAEDAEVSARAAKNLANTAGIEANQARTDAGAALKAAGDAKEAIEKRLKGLTDERVEELRKAIVSLSANPEASRFADQLAAILESLADEDGDPVIKVEDGRVRFGMPVEIATNEFQTTISANSILMTSSEKRQRRARIAVSQDAAGMSLFPMKTDNAKHVTMERDGKWYNEWNVTVKPDSTSDK